MATGMLWSWINSREHEKSHVDDVDVYLLFKKIQGNYYVNSVRLSHWQVVCHFKNSDTYKCYQLQTDNGDKNGRIVCDTKSFDYNGVIYYYYIGRIQRTEDDLENKAQNTHVNQATYVLGFQDCQTWATLFIKSLGMNVNSGGALLTKAALGLVSVQLLLADLFDHTFSIILKELSIRSIGMKKYFLSDSKHMVQRCGFGH